jgi:hypothetical protein
MGIAREEIAMKKKPAKRSAKRTTARASQDLTAKRTGPVGAVVFTSVSNVLKTRHDTAKNSISNVR